MNIETFKKAEQIINNINSLKEVEPVLSARISRFDDYIEWMDGRHQPIKFANKIYKKAEIKFNMDEHPMNVDTRDMFDLVEENKKDFIDFLKKCQNNYKKKLDDNSKSIDKLSKEFDNLKDEALEEIA